MSDAVTQADTMPARFDLIDEPWISVRYRDGTMRDVSILGAFSDAERITGIVGEVPTQSFAIARLLIAILSRALGGPIDERQWYKVWSSGLPLDEIDRYLDAHRGRFDLLHAATPFFQVADLRTAKNEVKDVAQLISDLPSNNRLFTTRAGSGIKSLSYAEAARWLVNVQAFDASGIKSGALGDARVKGGKGYPIGVGWTGLLGGVMVAGANLRETLLFNLVSPSAHYADEWGADLPPWEREPDGPHERADPHPTGPVDLATWQSRRVRLVATGGRVVGSLVANGDKLTPQNLFRLEMMTAWRYSEPQTKKNNGTVTFMPREHQPSRAFWRGIAALLPKYQPVTAGREHASALAPGVVQWISRLRNRGYLEHDSLIVLRAVGVVYGSNNSVIDEILDDDLLVPLAVLSDEHPELAQDAEWAVELVDQGVGAVRNLAANLARAAGEGELELDGPRQRAEERAYAALDTPYRRWLMSLTGDCDPDERIAAWKESARGILRQLGDELVEAAGPSAWVGRERSGRTGTELYTTSRAAGWFALALHKAFGPAPKKEDTAA